METVRLGGLWDGETKHQAGSVWDKNHISPTIDTMQGGNREPMIIDDTYANRQPRVYKDYSPALRSEREGLKTIVTISTKGKENEVASTILAGYERTNMTGFNADNAVVETVRIKQATKQGYIECEVGGVADLSFPDNKTRRGRVQENGQVSPTLMSGEQDVCRIEKTELYLSDKGKKYVCDPKRGMCTDINADVCQTLTAKGQSNWTGSFVSPDIETLEKSTTIGTNVPTKIHLKSGETITSNDNLTQYRIRKLTPLECWRLMDFTDEDFYKAAEVNSNTQLYKQAGNSIVKNVLVAILGQMIPGCENSYKGIDNE